MHLGGERRAGIPRRLQVLRPLRRGASHRVRQRLCRNMVRLSQISCHCRIAILKKKKGTPCRAAAAAGWAIACAAGRCRRTRWCPAPRGPRSCSSPTGRRTGTDSRYGSGSYFTTQNLNGIFKNFSCKIFWTVECGGVFNDSSVSSGEFTSPGYPSAYKNKQSCNYTIVARPADFVSLTFVEPFELENSRNFPRV